VNCKYIRPLLSAYLDGQLDPAHQTQVADHLATCPECASVLDDFHALGQEISALPDVVPPTSMRPAFEQRHGRRSAFPNSGTRLLASSAVAVALVAVLIGLAVVMSGVLRQMQVAGQPPSVVAMYPLNGATDVPWDANLTLTFSRAMDQDSVEAATHIVPEVQLAFAWQGKTLMVVPFADWRPGTAYILTIAGTAHDANGEAMVEPFALSFVTLPAEGEPEESLNPIGRFGQIWRAELGGPGGSLGYATAVEQELWCAEQHFERGQMFWLDQLREDPIYMLYYGAGEPGGNWQRYVDTWREGDPESAGLAPPTGLFEPIRGFGQLWREELNGPSALIGWALEPEQGFTGSVQPFEHGLMLWTPLDQAVYVLWDDGTWTAYPVLR